jgi:hypothetical protein
MRWREIREHFEPCFICGGTGKVVLWWGEEDYGDPRDPYEPFRVKTCSCQRQRSVDVAAWWKETQIKGQGLMVDPPSPF